MNALLTLTEQQKRARQLLQGKIKGKVLTVGCGDNDYLDRPEGTSFYAVDSCEEKVRAFQKIGKNAKCVCADSRALPFKSKLFETVIMVDLIHHLAGKDITETEANVRRCLNEYMRVMSAKGRIFIVEAFASHWLIGIEKLAYKVICFFVTLRYKSRRFVWSKKQLEILINKLGLLECDAKLLGSGSAMFTNWDNFPIKILFKCIPRKFVFLELKRKDQI